MAADEGAALGAALQAAWACACAEGKRASIGDFTTSMVALDESTRCEPDRARVDRYREWQARQDLLSTTLRPLFARQRKRSG
jgi:xylulokinase